MAREATNDLPLDRHYDRETHLWARLEDEGRRVRVGIDSLGLSSLGDLAFIAIRSVGVDVARSEPVGTLEAAKMTSPILAPVGGRIVERNAEVLSDPSLVNTDPYARGWLVVLEPACFAEDAAALASGDAVGSWAADEVARLRAESQAD